MAKDSRNACICKHYDYAPTYSVDGIVFQDAIHLGYAVAQRLPYSWEDHYEGGLVVAMVVVREGYGFMRAVDLPDYNVYEDGEFVDSSFDDED